MTSKIEQFYINSFTGNGKPITEFSLLLACSIFIFVLPIVSSEVDWFSIILSSIIIFLAALSISYRVILIGLGAIVIERITNATDLIYLNYAAELITNLFIW